MFEQGKTERSKNVKTFLAYFFIGRKEKGGLDQIQIRW